MMSLTTIWPILLLILVGGLAPSCGRNTSASPAVPASTAYTDGFEVAIFDIRDGIPVNARSVPLKEAEQAIAAGAQAFINGDPAVIQQKLSPGKPGDSRTYFTVTSSSGGRQQVRLAFHEGSRTFVYEYAVMGTTITPIQSAYRDLSRSEVVRYAPDARNP